MTTTNSREARGGGLVRKLVLMLSAFGLAILLVETIARVLLPHWAPRTAAVTRFWTEDSRLGWVHVPGKEGPFNASGFESFVSINSSGFRDEDRSLERDPAKYRIIVMGDSMVWGYGVEQDEIFTRLMERQNGYMEVINLGVSGYGTDQELLLLKQEGLAYRPDLVVLVVSENDFLTNVQSRVFRVYEKPMFTLEDDGSLVLSRSAVPTQSLWMRLAAVIARSSYVLNRLAQTLDEVRTRSREPWPPNDKNPVWKKPFPRNMQEKVTVALLSEAVRESKEAGADFLLVLIDGLGWVGRDTEDYFSSRSVRVLNLDRAFPKNDYELLHVDDGGHWSARGHEIVAESLLDYIEENELLPKAALGDATELGKLKRDQPSEW